MTDWVKIILCFILIGLMLALAYQKSLCENTCEIYCSSKCPICAKPDRYYDPKAGTVIKSIENPFEVDK